MSRVRATPWKVAVGLALGLALSSAVPVAAADPPTWPGRDRPAWDPQPPGPVATPAQTRLIVRFRAGTTGTQRRTVTARPTLTRLADLPASQLSVVGVAERDAAGAIAALDDDPNVLDVSVDHRNHRDADPQDESYWTEQWGLDNTGQRLFLGTAGTEGSANVDIDGLQALGVTTGDPGVVVAVIDDGVDFSHPDLAGQAWTNPGESGAGRETNGIDDDGNGYIDDVHGWDFCHNDNTVHDPDDDYHGTHVAGTIAASLDGGGVVGVAPGVRIMALKFISSNQVCGFDSQAIAAINYAKHFGVHIANASWGSYTAPASAPALKNAIATSGLLFVASAGNGDGTIGFDNDTEPFPAIPASFDLPNIVSVAAIDNSGRLAEFSNYGKKTVDIAAPGVAILSSVPAFDGNEAGWAWLDGTSMAAPHVTGTAALVLSMTPSLATDPVALRARLLGSGKAMPHTSGLTATGMIIDAFRALDTVAPTSPAPTGAGFIKGTILGRTSVSGRVSWPSGTDDLTGVSSYGVGVQVDGGDWAVQTSSTTKHTTDRTLMLVRTYAFRVRARDGAGNWGSYANGPAVRPTVYSETTSLATYAGSWSTSKSHSWWGGKTRYSRHAGASVTFRFTGRAFADRRAEGRHPRQVHPLRRRREPRDRRPPPLQDPRAGAGGDEDVDGLGGPHRQARRRRDERASAGRHRRAARDALTEPAGQLPRWRSGPAVALGSRRGSTRRPHARSPGPLAGSQRIWREAPAIHARWLAANESGAKPPRPGRRSSGRARVVAHSRRSGRSARESPRFGLDRWRKANISWAGACFASKSLAASQHLDTVAGADRRSWAISSPGRSSWSRAPAATARGSCASRR